MSLLVVAALVVGNYGTGDDGHGGGGAGAYGGTGGSGTTPIGNIQFLQPFKLVVVHQDHFLQDKHIPLLDK